MRGKSLIEELYERPYEFDFFQAVQILERTDTTRLALGGQGPPEREAVRILSLPSLNFPPMAECDRLWSSSVNRESCAADSRPDGIGGAAPGARLAAPTSNTANSNALALFPNLACRMGCPFLSPVWSPRRW